MISAGKKAGMISTGMKENFFSTIFKKYSEINLVLRIAAGIVLGVLLAVFFPGFKPVKMFGELFIGALKGIAPILVFVLVMTSLANGQVKKDGRFKSIVFLYLFSTFLAA